MGKYLDSNGLSHLMTLIKTAISNAVAAVHGLPSGGSQGQVLSKSSATDYAVAWTTPSASRNTSYGYCSTDAATAEKVVTCGSWTFDAGNIIGIMFSYANSSSVPTLNINSAGAKSIKFGNSLISGTGNNLRWPENTVIYFMYDGTYFEYIRSVPSCSSAQPDGAGVWYGTSSTLNSSSVKVANVDCFRLTPGAVVTIAFSTANSVSPFTLNVSSTGAKSVYVNNAVTSSSNTLYWSAGTAVTFIYSGTYWHYVCKSKISDKEMWDAMESASMTYASDYGVMVLDDDGLDFYSSVPSYYLPDLSGTYVPKTGAYLTNAMTGPIEIKNSNFDATEANNGVSSTIWPMNIGGNDANGKRVAFYGESIYANGDIANSIFAYNFDTSGNQVGSNYINVLVAKDGSQKYTLGSPAAFRTALGTDSVYYPLTGGLLSGFISRKGDMLDVTAANNGLSSSWNPIAFRMQDKNDVAWGYLQWYAHTSGYVYVGLDARKKSVVNQLRLRVNDDGTRVVEVSEAAPWRTALGLNSVTYGGTTSSAIAQVCTAASGITISSIYAIVTGNVVQLRIAFSRSSDISVPATGNITNFNVCTVLSGFRPYLLTPMTSYGDNAGPAFGYIGSDGTIALGAAEGTGAARTITAGTRIDLGATYVMA